MIQGRLIANLEESTGQVVEEQTVDGRRSWVADVTGLRADKRDVVFRLWVDAESGMVLRLERLDGVRASFELLDVRLGK